MPPARVSGTSKPRTPSGCIVGVLDATGDADNTGDGTPEREAVRGGTTGTIIVTADDEA